MAAHNSHRTLPAREPHPPILRRWCHLRNSSAWPSRAVANRPRLILADEPTGELDSTTAREVLTLFRNIVKHENLTVLMSSHDPLVDRYVDKIFQMKDGQIINNF